MSSSVTNPLSCFLRLWCIIQLISLCITVVCLQVQWHPRSSQTRVCKVRQPLPHEPPRPGQRPDRWACVFFTSNSVLSFHVMLWTKMWLHVLLFIVQSEYLKVRSHDPEEAIRHDVIVTIINAGKKDLNLVNDQLLGFVRERTLDKRVRHICTLIWCRCCYRRMRNESHVILGSRSSRWIYWFGFLSFKVLICLWLSVNVTV